MSFVYRVQLEGINQTQQAFQEVGQSIDQLQQSTYNFSLSQRAISEGIDFDRAVRGFRQLTGLGIVWAIQMERIEVGYSILESAQERYTRAVDKYGASSYQAIEAGKQLERIENYIYRAQLRSYASTIAVTSAMVLQSGVLSAVNRAKIASATYTAYQTVVEKIRTSSIWAEVQALIALHSLEGPVGWALLATAGGIAAGALATYGAMGGFNYWGGETQINISGYSEEELRSKLREREDQIIEDVNRAGR